MLSYDGNLLKTELKVSELARLEKLQYQIAKLVTDTLHLTIKDKLNVDLGWKSFNKKK